MNTQWTISIFAALIAAPLCLADVIHVPADEDTIQEGIDAASNGDTVIVADGLYAAAGDYNLVISGKTITVRSASGSPGCRIICPGTGSNYAFAITSNNSTIRGFTIENGTAGQSGDGGAMKCSGGSPKIISCVFKYNSAPFGGGAVSCMSGTTATFLACSFIQNSISGTIGKGGAVWVDGASPTFVNCLLLGNKAATHGAGIHGKNAADISLVNCTLAANELEAGTGVEGTAVSLAGSELTMTNSIVWDNVGPAGADVLYADGTSTQTVSYSDVQVVVSGTDNISEDPLFVTETLTGTIVDNLRLQAASPCINITTGGATGGGPVPDDTSDVDGDSDVTEDTPDLDWDERIQYDLLDMGCYEHRCTGDVNSDCLVDSDDFTDFVVGLSDWSGESEYAPCPAYSPADVNRDCQVNIDDLILFFASWGECPNGCGKPFYPGDPDLEEDTFWRHYDTPPDVTEFPVRLVTSPPTGTDPGDFQAFGRSGTFNFLLRDVTGGSTTPYEFAHLHTEVDTDDLDVDVLVTPTPAASPGALGSAADMPPYGFDVEYHITNISSSSVPLPDFIIGGIQLDAEVKGLQHYHGAHFATATSACTEENSYPTIRYAPVDVVLGTVSQDFGMPPQTQSVDVSVGVSLRYPVLQYQHDVIVTLCNHGGLDDDGWEIVGANVVGNSWTRAEIPAGESRTYTLSVRFMTRDDANDEDPEHWIYTLQPYQRYFWTTYGNEAKYAQDLRPVWGNSMASTYYQQLPETDPLFNERGYQRINLYGDPHQVHLEGWDFMVCYLKNYLIKIGQYERFMMWTPSGLYYDNPANNYPPQMLSDMTTGLPSIVLDTLPALKLIPDAQLDMEDYSSNINMGYWWGRAPEYADAWDDGVLDPLEIDVDAHVEAAYAELDRAVCLGASTIGMDSLRSMDVWDALPWMTRLWDKYPTLNFVAEPHCCDILHLHMPFATLHPNLVHNGVHHAPLLSDYLVPGRETWILLHGSGTYNAGHAYLMLGWGLTPQTNGTCIYRNDQLCGHVKCAAAGSWKLNWDAMSPGSIPPAVSCSATNPFTELAYSCPDAAPIACSDSTMSEPCCCSACSSPPSGCSALPAHPTLPPGCP